MKKLLLILTILFSTSAFAQDMGDGKKGAKVYTIATLPTCSATANNGQSVSVSDGNKGSRTCRNTNGSTYKWVDDNPVFNVQNFGACGGCSTAVNDAAILAAVSAAVPGDIIDFPTDPDGTSAVYDIATGIPLRMGLRYRGRGGGAIGSQSSYQGVVIRPTGAIWAFDRDVSQASVLSGVTIENINIQWSNSSVLGGINWDGISWGSITNVGIEPSADLVTRRYGVKVNTTSYGCYYNNFTNVHLRGNGLNRVTGFYFTGYAHENKVIGGSCQDCDIPVILEGVDGENIDGYAVDGSFDVAYKFIGGNQNRIWGGRAESYPKAGLSLSRTSNVVTVTHDGTTLFTVGQWVRIGSAGDSTFNLTYAPVQIASVPSTTTFTYAQTAADATTTGTLYFGLVASFDSTSKGNVIQYTNDQQVAKTYTESTKGTNTVAFNVGGSLAKWAWNKGSSSTGKGIQMGEWPVATDYWFLGAGGLDEATAGNYSFLWDNAGGLFINAPSGQAFALRYGNTSKATIGSTGLTIPSGSGLIISDTGTATATAGAATLNTQTGIITSEALTTASGSAYALTITNSKVTTSSIVTASVQNGTNSVDNYYVQRITPGSGSVTIVIYNASGGALNGTIKVSFIVM